MTSFSDKPVDRFGEFDIPLGHSARVMCRQPKVDPVPHIGELRMVVDLLRVHRDAGEEAERLAEVLELERAEQRFPALFDSPAFRSIHRDSPVPQPRYSLKA